MKYVLIPSDYVETGVVPIGIRTVDDKGRIVVPAWIEAVEPVAGELRDMSAVVTGDVHNVSLVTEGAVHSLSARHGAKLGEKPGNQIYASALWRAQNLRVGGGRVRKGREIEFRDIYVDSLRYDPAFAQALENHEVAQKLRKKAQELGRKDVATMIDLYLSEAEDQIASVFGVPPNSRERNTLTQRLRRRLRRLFESL